MATMRALWLENLALSMRADVPLPQPPTGEALVRVRVAGICSTDLELCRGYYPYAGVPGHEFVGEVVAAPGGAEWVGKRVVGEINAACGQCDACRAGRRHHCENRTVLGITARDGAFAEYLALPLENLHAVPAGLADEVAVFTEPLAAALEIQEQAQIRPGMRVVVIGAGRLGLLVAQTLALTGCDLSVVARQPRPRALLEARGIRAVTMDEVPAKRADLVVEATGSPEGFEQAARAVRPAGTIVLKSTYAGNLTVNMSKLTVDEITLVGSRCGPFAPALRLLEMGLVDPRAMIDARYPLDEAIAAFEHAGRKGVLKVLVSMG
jgi:threonine dehydrogenase-like Zn-dependent dehydrogenase